MIPARIFSCGVVLSVLSICHSAALAGSTLVINAQRQIQATLAEFFEIREVDNDTKFGLDLTVFDDTAFATLGGTGFAKITHRSELNEDQIRASGTFSGSFETDGGFGTRYSHLIEVTALTEVFYSLDASGHTDFPEQFAEPQMFFKLERQDEPGTVLDEALQLIDPTENSLSLTGILPAGNYLFSTSMKASNDDHAMSGEYDYELTFARTTPIPLPPAVWSALATIGATACTYGLRFRRHQTTH